MVAEFLWKCGWLRLQWVRPAAAREFERENASVDMDTETDNAEAEEIHFTSSETLTSLELDSKSFKLQDSCLYLFKFSNDIRPREKAFGLLAGKFYVLHTAYGWGTRPLRGKRWPNYQISSRSQLGRINEELYIFSLHLSLGQMSTRLGLLWRLLVLIKQ
ncbi:hypothetical protein M422DRAFT_261880 [Sphaerobolus stellatus SS14]|uniref:Uncharacterized protein n=1 Tax=Sphaerobolus stellatus (strain SS14) TaxID=990650 RepID=A0A0C9ULD7_SPHS4|nr:hypothetical protein M422DRAFT_261880 [Sphaerobolus stellatus SS14]